MTFLAFFDKLAWHPDYQSVIDPLRAFIATATEGGRIKDWAIIWPQRATAGRELKLDELTVPAPIFRRARRQPPRVSTSQVRTSATSSPRNECRQARTCPASGRATPAVSW